MNCKYFEHTITELTDLKTVADLPEEMKSHLESCDSCKQFYKVSLKLNAFLQERKSVDADDFFFTRVMDKVNTSEESSPKIAKQSFLRSYRSVAASILFIIALGLGILAGKYSANIYTNNTNIALQESSDVLGMQIADNSFDLINFKE